MSTLRVADLTLTERPLTWYTCGPTVYDHPHLGHARAYVSVDILHRLLANWFKVPVDTCMNITDIDDKIIRTASERGEEWAQLAGTMEQSFFEAMDRLGCARPRTVTRVTQSIKGIVDLVGNLVDAGFAYATDTGVYFDMKAFRAAGFEYGQLRAINEPMCNEADFALWKATKEGEPAWDSPWGRGRPGWHVECTAMATAAFGKTIDVHAGGKDLCFPHHENELAIAQAAAGEPFTWVRKWVHIGPLLIAGAKMSKSLRNFVKIEDALKKYTPRQLRLAFAMSRWWQPMTWSEEHMEEVRAKERVLMAFVCGGPKPSGAAPEEALRAKAAVDQALELLDTKGALDHVFALIAAARRGGGFEGAPQYVARVLGAMGIAFEPDQERLVGCLRELRAGVRALAKQAFHLCDLARLHAEEAGVVLDD